MPSFDVRWTRGVTVRVLEDLPRPAATLGPNDNGAPSRRNPRSNIAPLHSVAEPGALVTLSAVVAVGGVWTVAPPDSDLGGHLFTCRITEYPAPPRPLLFSGYGRSARWSFVARAPGHYTVEMLRGDGVMGRFISHLSVEP